MAQGYGNLQTMLDKVQVMLRQRDDLFSVGSRGEQPKLQTLDKIVEREEEKEVPDASVKSDEFDYRLEYKQAVMEAYVKEIQELSFFVKLYLYMRRNFVQDLLFSYSPEHLLDIVEQYRLGRISTRTAIEIGIMLRIRRTVMAEFSKKMADLVCENPEKWESTDIEFRKWREAEESRISPKQWEVVNVDTFDKPGKIFRYYLVLLWKILASNTQGICYILMIILAIQNGGLLYMIYPVIVFGYAFLLETGPGISYWYFVIVYTQVMLFLQVVIQLSVF